LAGELVYSPRMNIVFAHFNTPIPKHLRLNLARTKSLFPNHKIYLITNLNQDKTKDVYADVYHYNNHKEWDLLLNQLGHDKGFRGNFWFTSAARFLALAEFSKSNEGEFIHIESDVIIARDFPFELFSKSKAEIQYPIVSDSLAIASCLYVKNSKAANCLASTTISEALKDSKTTDMHILRTISNDEKSGYGMLATAPSARNSMPKVSDEFLKNNSEAISYYHGIFDGFNLGRYLFGDDPRNKRGWSKIRDSDTTNYLDVRKLQFSMNSDREFPFAYDSQSNKYIPIFSLHIHAKKLALFDIKSSSKKIRKAVEAAQDPTKSVFSTLTLIKSIKDSLLRRFTKQIKFYKYSFSKFR